MSNFRSHIERAVEAAGSQQKLANSIGCSQQQISYLLKDADRISAEMAVKVERATGGAVTASELRPDLWPAESERVAS